MSYRNSCQNENVKSLEEVIKHLLDESSRRAEEAQATVQVGPRDGAPEEQPGARPARGPYPPRVAAGAVGAMTIQCITKF